jgi:Flp pilus assembly protein CpaB
MGVAPPRKEKGAMTSNQASIGDALIFMTKCILGMVALVSTVAGLFLWRQGQEATAQNRIDAAAAEQIALARETLAVEQELSQEALNQVDLLTRQVNALRVERGSLQQKVVDLGDKLNKCVSR